MADPVTKPSTAPEPVASQPPVAPPAAPPEAQPVPEVSPWVQKATELGFADVKDEQEAFNRLATAYQQTREVKSQIDQALSELRQTKAPEQPEAPSAANGWWNPPQFDQALVQTYRTADGWRQDTPPDVRRQYDAYQSYVDQWANKLVRSPDQALKPILEAEFSRLFEEKYGQVSATQKEAALQEKVFSENTWLFKADPVTKQPTRELSPEGELIDSYFRKAESIGVQGFANCWEYAISLHKAAKTSLQANQDTTNTTAQAEAEKRRKELLAQGGVDRSGSVPQPGAPAPANRNLTFGQRFLQNAQRNGVTV